MDSTALRVALAMDALAHYVLKPELPHLGKCIQSTLPMGGITESYLVGLQVFEALLYSRLTK